MKRVVVFVFVAMFGLISFPAGAADLAVKPPAADAAEPGATLESYLNRRADLLLIRAMFNVVPHDEIVLQLGEELQRIGTDGPSEQDLQALDNDLLAEGSYLAVSLRYLVQAGGAAWPTDRPESFYENDALVQLPALQRRLMDAIADRSDPIDVLRELDAINAQTEGFTSIPDNLDHFGDRDALVKQALAQFNPRVDL